MMSVTQAAAAVQAAGCKTYAKAFHIQVNMALSNHPKLFKRLARGQYRAK